VADGTTARLIGAGSIACVYQVWLSDGRSVAVKARRPGMVRSLTHDLALLNRVAGLAARTPMLHGVPVTDIVGRLCDSIHAQLDLAREASLLDEFGRSMRAEPGVVIPAVDHQLSTSDRIVMEYVPNLVRRRPSEFVDADRERAVRTALRAVYRMLFLDGVVHCDLHPGNLYPRTDGTVVIVDAGFTVRLSDTARERFAAFFYCMSQGDGPACADIVLSTATNTDERADPAGFRAELTDLIERNAGRPAIEFDLVRFATALFDLQRRHGFYADPQFVFPILSLLVLEGVIREYHPTLDFQREARPFLAMAMFECVAKTV
jgi:ubiquinone biosynthesis protein